MITFTNNGINTSILDYHARQFIDAAKLTDEIQIRALHELCKDLKRDGIWDKLRIIYPFVYNSAFTASVLYDLKGVYNLTIGNATSPTASIFSSNGVKFNGGQTLQSGVINELKASNFGNIGQPLESGRGIPYAPPGHISIYNRFNSYGSTNSTYDPKNSGYNTVSTLPGSGQFAYSFGTNSVKFGFANINPFNFIEAASKNVPFFGNSEVSWSSYTASTDTSGFWIYSAISGLGYSASIVSPQMYNLVQNGQFVDQFPIKHQYTSNSPYLVFGGYVNSLGHYVRPSYDEICWYSIGWSNGRGSTSSPFYGDENIIQSTEYLSFYQIVQKFQTALGRQV
jgi:hypothetical protein